MAAAKLTAKWHELYGERNGYFRLCLLPHASATGCSLRRHGKALDMPLKQARKLLIHLAVMIPGDVEQAISKLSDQAGRSRASGRAKMFSAGYLIKRKRFQMTPAQIRRYEALEAAGVLMRVACLLQRLATDERRR